MLDLTGSIRDGLSSREGTEGSRTCGIFLVAGSGEPDEAGGAEGEHLERVPDADRGDDVEPAGPALVNQSGVSGGDQEVWDGEEHREESVLHAAASADLADDDVAGPKRCRAPWPAVLIASPMRNMAVSSCRSQWAEHLWRTFQESRPGR